VLSVRSYVRDALGEHPGFGKIAAVAALVTTLITTLKSATDLYGRVRHVRQREEHNEEEIKKLKDRHERHEREDRKRERTRASRGEHDVGDLEGHINDSRMLIRKEYDFGYDRLGQRFAIGDAIAQMQLQAELIALQQTLIRLFEFAFYASNTAAIDLRPILGASEKARHGSIAALSEQYQRLLQQNSIPRRLSHPPQLQRSLPALHIQEKDVEVEELHEEVHESSRGGGELEPDELPLFCRYALDLQRHDELQLSPHFSKDGDKRCPACFVHIAIEPHHAWEITQYTRATEEKAPGPVHRRHSWEVLATPNTHLTVDIHDDARSRKSSRAPDDRKSRRDEHEDGASNKSVRGQSHRSSRRSSCSVSPIPRTRTPSPMKRVFRVANRFIVKCHRDVGRSEFACVICSREREKDVLCGSIRSLVRHVWLRHDFDEYQREIDIREVD